MSYGPRFASEEEARQTRATGETFGQLAQRVIDLKRELSINELAAAVARKNVVDLFGFTFEVGWGYMSRKDNKPWVCVAVEDAFVKFSTAQGIARVGKTCDLYGAYIEFEQPPTKHQIVGVQSKIISGGQNVDYTLLGILEAYDYALATVRLYGRDGTPYLTGDERISVVAYSIDRVHLTGIVYKSNYLQRGGAPKTSPAKGAPTDPAALPVRPIDEPSGPRMLAAGSDEARKASSAKEFADSIGAPLLTPDEALDFIGTITDKPEPDKPPHDPAAYLTREQHRERFPADYKPFERDPGYY